MRPHLLDDELPVIRRLARRTVEGEPYGITAPDVAELYELSERTARKILARWVRDGWLVKTTSARHRPDMVATTRCRPAIIYAATDKALEASTWQARLSRTRPVAPRRTG